jgi:tRNA(Ile)-lysidine synthase TilS/MesJ
MISNLNYLDWKNDNRLILESLPGKTIMMLYSGGKDSSVVLHLIQKASTEFGFSYKTFAGIFPNHVFSIKDRDELDSYWKAHDVTINWHTLQNSDDQLDSALSEGVSPCLICNTAKKQALINFLKAESIEMGSLVIIIGYSLWDIVSASIEHTLTFNFSLSDAFPPVRHKSTEERFFETAQRFYPFLEFKSGFAVFKPLIRYNDQDILKIISDEGIPLLSTQCRFRNYRPKRLFSQYYERMNIKFDFEKVLEFTKSVHHLPEKKSFTELGEESYLRGAI